MFGLFVIMHSKMDNNPCRSRRQCFGSEFSSNDHFEIKRKTINNSNNICYQARGTSFADLLFEWDANQASHHSNLYVAIHEERELLKFLTSSILYLRRFIDDGLAIWLHDPDPQVDAANWIAFTSAVKNGGFDWTFTFRAPQVDFMDMTIKMVDSKIETTMHEKPLALHLYIPPHSCHAPGVSTSTVMGEVLRIFQLCSHEADIEEKLCTFYGQLLDRGYQARVLTNLFDRAITSAKQYLLQSDGYRQHLHAKKQDD